MVYVDGHWITPYVLAGCRMKRSRWGNSVIWQKVRRNANQGTNSGYAMASPDGCLMSWLEYLLTWRFRAEVILPALIVLDFEEPAALEWSACQLLLHRWSLCKCPVYFVDFSYLAEPNGQVRSRAGCCAATPMSKSFSTRTLTRTTNDLPDAQIDKFAYHHRQTATAGPSTASCSGPVCYLSRCCCCFSRRVHPHELTEDE